MRRWIESIARRSTGSIDTTIPVDAIGQLELLVVEGDDAGQRFTLDGDIMHVGRRPPNERAQREILLNDTTVSSRQAQIVRHVDGYRINHIDSATNLTLVDGEIARESLLAIGSEIRIGRVVLLVKNYNDWGTQETRTPTTELVDRNSKTLGHAKASRASSLSDPPPVVSTTDGTVTGMAGFVFVGQLVVVQGAQKTGKTTFPIEARSMLLGRADNCDIQILDAEISRVHAELAYEDNVSYLIHRSETKSTKLNMREISGRERLENGDVITLANRIQLRVDLHDGDTAMPQTRPKRAVSGRGAGGSSGNESASESLQRVMEEKLRLDRTIEEQYTVEGSFFDVDVVDSYGMKAGNITPEHTIVSFERFRQFVGDVVTNFDGQVLNSNGDELMCFFESPLEAVKAGSALIDGLEDFNRRTNLLPVPFRVRVGIHTGRSLVDLERGVAYSEILDVAGHLQKKAATGCVAVSQATLDKLPEGMPFERSGEIDRGVVYYTMTGPIR